MNPDHLLSGAAPTHLGLDSLDSQPRWVLWKQVDQGSRVIKMPLRPDGQPASATDPHDWFPRAVCEAALGDLEAAGLGLVLGPLADGMCLGGIDLDNCRDNDTLTPWAQDIVDRLGTYSEVSPSGTGAKLFFLLTQADYAAVRTHLGDRDGRKWSTERSGNHPPAIELYLNGRYFTLTGQSIGAPHLRVISAADLVWLKETAASQFPAKSPGQFSQDNSRSAKAMSLALGMRGDGYTFEEYVAALARGPELAGWLDEKGLQANGRELDRTWAKAAEFLLRNQLGDLGDPSSTAGGGDVFGDLDRFRIANMTKGEPPELRFLLKDLMPLGTLGVVYGPGGVGKSLLAMDLCLEVANLNLANDNSRRSQVILDTTVPAYARGASIFLTLEDDADEVHRRTASLDPDRTRRNGPCYVIPASSLNDFDPTLVSMRGPMAALTTLAQRGLPKLLDNVAADAGCPVRLLVLDPAGDFINGDENDAAPVKILMRRLRDLSNQHCVTTILLGHVPKSSQGGQQTMRGSSAWMANARFAYSLEPKSKGANDNASATAKQAMKRGLIEGCLTKANHAGAPINQVKRFYRDDRGRLVCLSSGELGGKAEPTDEDLVDMLARQCAKYAEAGMPFAHSGKRGLWEGRKDLDSPLSDLPKKRLQEIGKLALDSGLLIKVKTSTCRMPIYLDVPNGGLTHGVAVELPEGSRRKALRDREKAADG